MALIANATYSIFDLTQIHRGDCVRIRRTGDSEFRNGFITEATQNKLRMLYCNLQNQATSYLDILAVDVTVGVWEIYWTNDFQTINYENNAPDLPVNPGNSGV